MSVCAFVIVIEPSPNLPVTWYVVKFLKRTRVGVGAIPNSEDVYEMLPIPCWPSLAATRARYVTGKLDRSGDPSAKNAQARRTLGPSFPRGKGYVFQIQS